MKNTKPFLSKFEIAVTSPSWKPSEFALNGFKNSGGLMKRNNKKLKNDYFNELQETRVQLKETNVVLIFIIKEYASLKNLNTESETYNYKRSGLKMENASFL